MRYAIDRAGDGASALDILETLHTMCTDLEDRAPGVNFAEILGAWDPDTALRGRKAAALALMKSGMSRTDVNDLISLDGKSDPTMPTVYEQHPAFDSIVAERAQKVPAHIIAAKYNCSEQFVYRCVHVANGTWTKDGNLGRQIRIMDVAQDPAYSTIRTFALANPSMGAAAVTTATGARLSVVKRALAHLSAIGERTAVPVVKPPAAEIDEMIRKAFSEGRTANWIRVHVVDNQPRIRKVCDQMRAESDDDER